MVMDDKRHYSSYAIAEMALNEINSILNGNGENVPRMNDNIRDKIIEAIKAKIEQESRRYGETLGQWIKTANGQALDAARNGEYCLAIKQSEQASGMIKAQVLFDKIFGATDSQ